MGLLHGLGEKVSAIVGQNQALVAQSSLKLRPGIDLVRTGAFLIDVSGSVAPFGKFIGKECQPEMMRYMRELNPKGTHLELLQAVFSGKKEGVQLLHEAKPIGDAECWNEFTFSRFQHNQTALYLALIDIVGKVTRRVDMLQAANPQCQISCFIGLITDGKDNDSRDLRERCKAELVAAYKKYKLEFYYVGIGHESFREDHHAEGNFLGATRTSVYGNTAEGYSTASRDLSETMSSGFHRS